MDEIAVRLWGEPSHGYDLWGDTDNAWSRNVPDIFLIDSQKLVVKRNFEDEAYTLHVFTQGHKRIRDYSIPSGSDLTEKLEDLAAMGIFGGKDAV